MLTGSSERQPGPLHSKLGFTMLINNFLRRAASGQPLPGHQPRIRTCSPFPVSNQPVILTRSSTLKLINFITQLRSTEAGPHRFWMRCFFFMLHFKCGSDTNPRFALPVATNPQVTRLYERVQESEPSFIRLLRSSYPLYYYHFIRVSSRPSNSHSFPLTRSGCSAQSLQAIQSLVLAHWLKPLSSVLQAI